MVRHKPKRQADVILLIATHVIFVKSSYIPISIGYMFSISMLLRQLFIGRFWYDDDSDDDCADDDSDDDDDYDKHDYIVYILIFIMFIT